MSEFKDPAYQDYIAHHGVLGMHWGVRRYQNSDGSLTDKGKLRFKKVSENSKLQEKQSKKAKKQNTTHSSFNVEIKIIAI